MILLLITIRSSYQATYPCNASASCGCSANSATLSRIVGGENAASQTWGWAVSLYIGSGYLCGGSIISSSWIITAAHCVYGFTASQVTVYAGSLLRWTGSQTSGCSQIIIHASYDTKTYANDIALVQLATPFNMSDPRLSRICLPSVSSEVLSAGEWPAAGTTVVAVGWGRLTESGSLPANLQQVTLQTIASDASTCRSLIADWHLQFCAGVSGGGKDTCQGDSGGPLMMFTSANGWILIGLTSNGIGCAQAAYAGVYTRVAYYEDWIASYTSPVTGVSKVSSLSTTSSITKSITSTTTSPLNRSHAYTVKMPLFSVFTLVMFDLFLALSL